MSSNNADQPAIYNIGDAIGDAYPDTPDVPPASNIGDAIGVVYPDTPDVPTTSSIGDASSSCYPDMSSWYELPVPIVEESIIPKEKKKKKTAFTGIVPSWFLHIQPKGGRR